MAYRIFKAKRRLKEMQSYFDKIKLIQHMYTSIKTQKNLKKKQELYLIKDIKNGLICKRIS